MIELYEGRHQSNATAFSSFSPPPPPMVVRQSYIINAHVTAMHPSVTEKGLTSKQVISKLTKSSPQVKYIVLKFMLAVLCFSGAGNGWSAWNAKSVA